MRPQPLTTILLLIILLLVLCRGTARMSGGQLTGDGCAAVADCASLSAAPLGSALGPKRLQRERGRARSQGVEVLSSRVLPACQVITRCVQDGQACLACRSSRCVRTGLRPDHLSACRIAAASQDVAPPPPSLEEAPPLPPLPVQQGSEAPPPPPPPEHEEIRAPLPPLPAPMAVQMQLAPFSAGQVGGKMIALLQAA